MIFFANNDGTIVYSQPSPVHQGGANTNNIYLFAPFATNSSVTVGFLLPDGSIFPREGPALMTWRGQIPYTDEDGNLLSGWTYSMPNTVLQKHGVVTVQFLYYNAVGEIVASSSTSFNVEKGDFYGLIGLNGSGKSTLLKIISGVYKPTTGKTTVHGTIAPLIELGAGFDMDLTARENIYLNGTVLGMTPKFIDSKFDEIVEFSELRDFLDVPLKNYSSGMTARLAFAVATMTKPDILIADEILSVGDFLFQQKCEKRMAELMSGGTTVILVSHSIEQIERMCNKVAWLDHGHLRRNGPTAEVTAEYKSFEKPEN